MALPQIIQGGMGIGVSGWRLANAVSKLGQLGVVSGTGTDIVMVRRLQLGDTDGSARRALKHFPVPEITEWILNTYFVQGGKSQARFRPVSMPTAEQTVRRQQLSIAANFVEVFLAKEGHAHEVGINYLDKIKLTMLPALYGAMLAGVDYVLIGAGIPREIPGVLDGLSTHSAISLKLPVAHRFGSQTEELYFDPIEVLGKLLPELQRPKFLPIVGSAVLATALHKKNVGAVQGFVVEGPSAGGHVVPPRGPLRLNEEGEPIYGPKDAPDFHAMSTLGLPFWLAGSYGRPEKFEEALACGATGIQVGTAFAFCEESGMEPSIKQAVLQKVLTGSIDICTSMVASPTGFPFKMLNLEGTLFDEKVYSARPRVCDVGCLREVYRKEDGKLGYRCSAEPEEDYNRKGGAHQETEGRRCLCNALLATVGLGQTQQNGYVEPPLVTAGDDLSSLCSFVKDGQLSYSASDVVVQLLANRA